MDFEIYTINRPHEDINNQESGIQYLESYLQECEHKGSCHKNRTSWCTRFAFYWPITLFNFIANFLNFLLSGVTFIFSFINIDIEEYINIASYVIIALILLELCLSFLSNWILESKFHSDLLTFRRWLIEENQWPLESGMDNFCVCNIFNCFWKGECKYCAGHCCRYYSLEYFYHPRPLCVYQKALSTREMEKFRQSHSIINQPTLSYITSHSPILYNEEMEARSCSCCASRKSKSRRKTIFECLESLLECSSCILDWSHKIFRVVVRILLQLGDNISPLIFIDYVKFAHILTPVLAAISMLTSMTVMFDIVYGEWWRSPQPVVCVMAKKLREQLIQHRQLNEVAI